MSEALAQSAAKLGRHLRALALVARRARNHDVLRTIAATLANRDDVIDVVVPAHILAAPVALAVLARTLGRDVGLRVGSRGGILSGAVAISPRPMFVGVSAAPRGGSSDVGRAMFAVIASIIDLLFIKMRCAIFAIVFDARLAISVIVGLVLREFSRAILFVVRVLLLTNLIGVRRPVLSGVLAPFRTILVSRRVSGSIASCTLGPGFRMLLAPPSRGFSLTPPTNLFVHTPILADGGGIVI